jgi:serine-type D-Ala-D-Ala endopeptidase (penicillin-binding protein 7)
VGFVNKMLSTGLVALAAALVLALPAPASAASGTKSAKKRPVAVHKSRVKRVARVVPERPSYGQLAGLRSTQDNLELKSSVALVMDLNTDEVLFSKNSTAVLPIASITKLMTAMVVTDAKLPLDETLTVSQDDVDTEKGSRSRLKVGTQLTREEMLHLALMSSENRAAHALGRHYPGGLSAFVQAMNAKAQLLGMHDTHYVEPTGLSSKNQSSARDLATLVKAAHEVELIRTLSTSPEYVVEVGKRPLQFRNTNGLVRNSSWEIGLQKTGYIAEAGRCLVMQAKLAGRQLIMVFLDSTGKYSRIGDAERVRRWVNQLAPPAAIPASTTTEMTAAAVTAAAVSPVALQLH